MLNKIKVENVRTSITGEIQGVVVNINFENIAGEVPSSITAIASIMEVGAIAPYPGMMPGVNGCVINIIHYPNDTRDIKISGNKTLAEAQPLIDAIEAEMELIEHPV